MVIGAGLAGLLAALHPAREGREVLVLERAGRPGGRFTAGSLGGAEVSTGALHLLPNGSSGALARLLRQLPVPLSVAGTDTLCAVWMDAEQVACPGSMMVEGVAERVRRPRVEPVLPRRG